MYPVNLKEILCNIQYSISPDAVDLCNEIVKQLNQMGMPILQTVYEVAMLLGTDTTVGKNNYVDLKTAREQVINLVSDSATKIYNELLQSVKQFSDQDILYDVSVVLSLLTLSANLTQRKSSRYN